MWVSCGHKFSMQAQTLTCLQLLTQPHPPAAQLTLTSSITHLHQHTKQFWWLLQLHTQPSGSESNICHIEEQNHLSTVFLSFLGLYTKDHNTPCLYSSILWYFHHHTLNSSLLLLIWPASSPAQPCMFLSLFPDLSIADLEFCISYSPSV